MYFANNDQFLLVLYLLPAMMIEAVSPHNLECSPTRYSTLCLVQGYSTFDLPMQHKENLVRIGMEYKRGNTNLIIFFRF